MKKKNRSFSIVSLALVVLVVLLFAASPPGTAQTGPLYNVTNLGTLPGSDTSYSVAINENGQVIGDTSGGGLYKSAFFWSAQTGIGALGTLGGTYSKAVDLNDSGQVIGYANGRSFLWDVATQMARDLNDLIPLNSGWDLTTANDINNLGEIAGYGTYNGQTHAFLLKTAAGTVIDLGILPGGDRSRAFGINDLGEAVGSSRIPVNGQVIEPAVLWQPSGQYMPSDLGLLGSKSLGGFINNSGQAVGWWFTQDIGSQHAFFWEVGLQGLIDIGSLGGIYDTDTWTRAHGLNELGETAGTSFHTSRRFHAFFWDRANGIRDLGTLGGTESRAEGSTSSQEWALHVINNNSQVVGWPRIKGDKTVHAFIWDKVNGMRDLNNLIGTTVFQEIRDGAAINNEGQIAGSGVVLRRYGGGRRACLLTPK